MTSSFSNDLHPGPGVPDRISHCPHIFVCGSLKAIGPIHITHQNSRAPYLYLYVPLCAVFQVKTEEEGSEHEF